MHRVVVERWKEIKWDSKFFNLIWKLTCMGAVCTFQSALSFLSQQISEKLCRVDDSETLRD